ncbi:MAG: hypothetical protein WEA80_02190 [Gemmatimonadaceae bacterium]
MQTQVEAPPAQATAPTAPGLPVGGAIVIQGVPGVPAQTISIPLSLGDVRWLRARRSELAEQLSDAKDRREAITDEWGETSSAIQGGLAQQLAQLDQRILQLESDLAQTEQILTSAPSGFLASAEPPTYVRGGDNDTWVMIPALLIMFVPFPLVFAHARRIWKRAPAARINPAEAGRLERIEQAVEAIAIEVERVSEGQRFVTRLMSEGKVASIPSPREL